ncbi:MAG: biopolymer transporter ExbD [Bacteroidales bacterium]
MAKIKMHRASPRIDMTPMVDLFTLLLTFFMLTTSFKPSEAVIVDTPNSISEKTAPDKNLMMIYISKENKIYFNLDNGLDSTTHIRAKVLEEMGKQYGVTFTEKEKSDFGKLGSFGVPMKDMKKWINADNSERSKFNIGIPCDTADHNKNNELNKWVLYTRFLNPSVEAAVKGDAKADYTTAKMVFDILLDNKLSRFNLTTNMEKVEIKLNEYKN